MRSMSMGDFIRVYKWYILTSALGLIVFIVAAFMLYFIMALPFIRESKGVSDD